MSEARFPVVVVGHVDHGKSTFIGRLLHDTGSLPDGKIEQVRRACAAEGMDFEYAFLLDSLLEEQKQNITIDTTRFYFRTPAREYAIIDAPGHREFLKNMVTGAASAQAAFLLIDGREGVQDQSRRHALLLSLLGVRNVVVLINKMDLVSYSESHYVAVAADFREFLATLNITPVHVIPVAAKMGENIARRSESMPWWKGPTAAEALDQFRAEPLPTDRPLRFSLQDIYRFDERRIFAGRIETGRLKVGDELTFQPGNRTATVRSIEGWPDGGPSSASTGESVGFLLEPQIFVERGAIASLTSTPPSAAQRFRARVFWMGKEPLKLKKRYELRLLAQSSEAEVLHIERVVDAADLSTTAGGASSKPAEVPRDSVAELVIRTRKPIAFDLHATCDATGRFVLVDGAKIAGGGIITASVESDDLFPTKGPVTSRERERRNGHPGSIIWLTGLSGSGKSTIAGELERRLFLMGRQVYWIDGDNLRTGLGSDLGFSPEARSENIRRAAEVGKLFADAGVICIISLISPMSADRDRARSSAPPGRFLEVFVNAPIEVCEKRDPKGLYAKARAGGIKEFTGISAPYEAPSHPDLELQTDKLSVDACVNAIIEKLHIQFQGDGSGI
jgi:bifunctional enzyme CysN/CysC